MDSVGSIQSSNLDISGGTVVRGCGTDLGTAQVSGTASRTDEFSSTSLSLISQNTQPQSPSEFGTLALAALLLGEDDDESKKDPLRALIGLALLSQLQQQSQQTQYLQIDSQHLQSSQSVSLNTSSGTASTGATGDSAVVGAQLDVSA